MSLIYLFARLIPLFAVNFSFQLAYKSQDKVSVENFLHFFLIMSVYCLSLFFALRKCRKEEKSFLYFSLTSQVFGVGVSVFLYYANLIGKEYLLILFSFGTVFIVQIVVIQSIKIKKIYVFFRESNHRLLFMLWDGVKKSMHIDAISNSQIILVPLLISMEMMVIAMVIDSYRLFGDLSSYDYLYRNFKGIIHNAFFMLFTAIMIIETCKLLLFCFYGLRNESKKRKGFPRNFFYAFLSVFFHLFFVIYLIRVLMSSSVPLEVYEVMSPIAILAIFFFLISVINFLAFLIGKFGSLWSH